MLEGCRVGVVIPALDERNAIGRVIADIPAWVDTIVVADNGSRDGTADVARAHGATVVHEPERGYGAACLAGLTAIGAVDVVVFMDGDYSDHAEDMIQLVVPIVSGVCDFAIGSRVRGARERGALTPQQVAGNWLATRFLRLIWGAEFTDLGPFRAIRRTALDRLNMADRTFGWTIEMQIKATKAGLRVREVPVRYRRRIGVSKISGTFGGTLRAGYKIMAVIARYALRA